MPVSIPITLYGINLGQRHLYLNSLVNNTYEKNEDYEKILHMPENSPLDRIFKIDLASKHRNIDYILENIQDDDMLFVNRALKCKWMVETKYEHVFNPHYLDSTLFPLMITSAVTKVKNWLYLNLKDENRCQQFYRHYRESDFDYAIKYFMHCNKVFIQDEFPHIVHKITPHYFKILCERTSNVAKIFFELLANDQRLISLYLSDSEKYFNVLKHLLKTETELVLDITEKYFDTNNFKPFSSTATRHIMKNNKEKFWRKPELYTAFILNLKTLADCLDTEEIKVLVIRLAKAEYLKYLGWSSYKRMEPLIKRLICEERVELKNKVFVQKDFGDKICKWQYEPPSPPVLENIDHASIFDDRQPDIYLYAKLGMPKIKRKIRKKCGKHENVDIKMCEENMKVKTVLDKLFDEFRFASFGKTLYELRKRITVESSSINREFMMLVLVSKSGGRPEAISSLMELLASHINEPVNIRATIIRSLVKRAFVWRLPDISWNQFLNFGRGLGLDGSTPEADCLEGLHAVVIRSLLKGGDCIPSVRKAYWENFSNFSEYSLTGAEKKCISNCLPKMLLTAAKEESDMFKATHYINTLIDFLNAYHIKISTYPDYLDLINVLTEFSEKDISSTTYLLVRLYEAKIARKELFKYTFDIIKTDMSYVNALRHDPSILNPNTFVEYYIDNFILYPEQFFLKLALYFGEEDGIATQFLKAIKTAKRNRKLARPLSLLLKAELISFIIEVDLSEDIDSRLLASSLRANAHLARPVLDISSFGWKKCGVKLIANRISTCRLHEIDNYIKELLKAKRFAKLAYNLSKRVGKEIEVIENLLKLRSTPAVKIALKFIRTEADEKIVYVWDIIKPTIKNIEITKQSRRYISILENIESIPIKLRPEYATVIYNTFRKISLYVAMVPLCHIEILISQVDEEFLYNLLLFFVTEEFNFGKLSFVQDDILCHCLFLRILVKFIILSKSDNVQKQRIEIFFNPLLNVLKQLKKSEITEHQKMFNEYTKEIFITLKYNKAFLEIEYVSPIPLIENIILFMQSFFPIEEKFDQYVHFHLTILYFKAIRQSVKCMPDIFVDKKTMAMKGEEVVAEVFGKYIAKEVKSLIGQYFESVTELYLNGLLIYLDNYFHQLNSVVLTSLVKGLLSADEGALHRLAIKILVEKQYSIQKEHFKEVIEVIKEYNNEEAQWFVFAEIEGEFGNCL